MRRLGAAYTVKRSHVEGDTTVIDEITLHEVSLMPPTRPDPSKPEEKPERRRRAAPDHPGTPVDTPAEALHLEHRLKRQQTTNPNWHSPYDDGSPDYPELISDLTQKRRDEILERIVKVEKKR